MDKEIVDSIMAAFLICTASIVFLFVLLVVFV